MVWLLLLRPFYSSLLQLFGERFNRGGLTSDLAISAIFVFFLSSPPSPSSYCDIIRAKTKYMSFTFTDTSSSHAILGTFVGHRALPQVMISIYHALQEMFHFPCTSPQHRISYSPQQDRWFRAWHIMRYTSFQSRPKCSASLSVVCRK